MAARDRVVRWALGAGVVLAALAWHFVGPWIALVLVLVALGVAAVAYRIEPSRIDVDHPASWGRTSAEQGSAERVDQ